ncbi:hypothetical protein KJR06_08235 [Streptococcus lutetiensis]|uniref:hypothetical protein n=1 Tax=Streptococcus lutetiensis TaxID=150055 RepID=UPI001BDAE2A7|nr:hypothetical protein [Streptococcus lutetiensis]MBT0906326.1 hypothetical protein [Streptococcus lutetiensis]
MKKWKTISITALTTLGLIAGGSFVYTSNQPAHYEGKTFKSNVSSSTTEESSSTTEESSLPEMDAYGTETASAEDNSYEGLYINNGPGPYNCIGDNAEPVSRYGFYIMTPMQRTNQIMVIQCGASREKEVYDDMVIVHGENNDSDLSELNCDSAKQNAEAFCRWLRQEAPSGHTTNGLQSNYDYWVKNCKYKYKQ